MGVVSTQETEIHPSSDLTPYPEQRIWDERDIQFEIDDRIAHEYGSLAAIELAHNGNHSINQLTRAPILVLMK